VLAANRTGRETDDGITIDFYGSSFLTDPVGAMIACASRTREEIVIGTVDLDQAYDARDYWGVYHTRRPEMYRTMVETPAGPPPR
jgi:N-carbamoylputrescine amidase